MKIGLIIPIFNRANYLADCLWSLERVKLPKSCIIMLIDDGSADKKTIELVHNFKHPTNPTYRETNAQCFGVQYSLMRGYEHFFNIGVDLVINFDSDAVIRSDAIEKLIAAYMYGTLLTGFHSTTLNTNGSERHHIISEQANTYFKQSVGGINFCVDKQAYEQYVKPALNKPGNWDHNACINAGGAYCLKKSVVQHIGFDSSLGHHEQPDIADDFYYCHLPTVTLIGVDSNADRLKIAANKCTKWIKFGDVKLLHPNITSKEQYSEFCIKELYKHVDTEHLLIFQHDGFVHNWKAWDDDWLQYDYIGAPWYYQDGMAVGNGGFSLRSKRLMEILANDPHICFTHPEDHHICRTYRPYLESNYGIHFAPLHVAERFSYEGYMQPHTALADQFGVHGSRNIVQRPKRDKLLPLQFRGLGDILFLIPMIRELMNEGNEITWPIDPEYLPIAKHFPDINFVDMRTVHINYNERSIVHTQYGRSLPYRFAAENMGLGMTKCMDAKYTMFGHDYKIWRNLYWKRFTEREKELAKMVGATGKYVLVNRNFADAKLGYKIEPRIESDLPVIEMSVIPGYTLIDWMLIIENASEIHVANSSINYLIELMDIKAPVYMYKRGLWSEQGFEHTRHLWENKCWRFVE